MVQDGKYILMNIAEFTEWLSKQDIKREIYRIQMHHTWSPSYKSFTGKNQIALMKSMENYHVKSLGFSDIAQHISTFSDGSICIGRSFEKKSGGFYGSANNGGICIENIGNFDKGGDVMTEAQKQTIIAITALLCIKFNIKTDDKRIEYHAWYKTNSSIRDNDDAKKNDAYHKTCPGSNFFGGNSVSAFNKHFKPLIDAKIKELTAPATDYSGHWAEKHIQEMVDKKIMVGDGKGTFNPNNTTTRAEIAVVVSNILKYLNK